jgi:hypothetical protein
MFAVSPRPGGNYVAERILIGIGAALIALSPYLPWFQLAIFGDINLTRLASLGHAYVIVAFAPTILGIPALLVAALARSMQVVRVSALVIGVAIALAGSYATYGLIDAVTKSAGFGQLGIGPIVALVGAALMVVPPIVGYAQQPAYLPEGRAVFPLWLPAALALPLATAIGWIPDHAGPSNYCGTPVGAVFKNHQPLPSDTPPPGVAATLAADQSAVASAQNALNAAQQNASLASQQQNAADAASSSASNADNAAATAAGTVSQDQGNVSSDQVTVQSDQSTISVDQSTIGNDQSTIQLDQQNLASDQANGFPTDYDKTQLANDQQTLANDQATLAKDQATLSSDQAALTQAEAQQSSDQQAANAAQQRANTADQQAQSSENTAQNSASSADQAASGAQQQLDTAQQQLDSDQQNWSDTYNAQLAAAQTYNSDLSACQARANNRFIASGALGVLGLGATAGLVLARRRRGNDFSPPPPAATTTF